MTTVIGRAVKLEASELKAYIDSLPRLLTENLYLEPSGELDTIVDVRNFYGTGSLVIDGRNNSFSMSNKLTINSCFIPVHIYNINFQEPVGMGGDSGVINIEYSYLVKIGGCKITGLGEQSGASAINIQLGGNLHIDSTQISNFRTAVVAARGSILSMDSSSSTFSNNRTGASVWNGGVILLGNNIPNTLGGTTNAKAGGLIIKGDGTLL